MRETQLKNIPNFCQQLIRVRILKNNNNHLCSSWLHLWLHLFYSSNVWRYIAKFGENFTLMASIKRMNFEAITFNNEKN